MRGSKKKYLYIETPRKKYVKARVMLEGRDEPSVTPTMDASKIIIVGKPTRKVPYNYKVAKYDDLPPEIRAKLEHL